MFLSSGTVEELSTIDLAAIALTVNGKFDDKLAQLKSAKDVLDAKQLVVDTIEQANKLLADAQAQATVVASQKSEADARDASLVQRETDLQAGLTDLSTREKALESGKDLLATQLAAFALSQTTAEQSLAADKAAFIQDQANQQAQLQSELNDLDLAKKAFNDKLNALKA